MSLYTVEKKSSSWEAVCASTDAVAIGRCAESALKNLLSLKRLNELAEFAEQPLLDDTWIVR